MEGKNKQTKHETEEAKWILGVRGGSHKQSFGDLSTKNRSLTRDIWQDASDPELRVQGRIFQLEMLEVKGE